MSYKIFEVPSLVDVIENNLVDPETGEILTAVEAQKLIESIQIERDKKVEYLCKLVKNCQAEADVLKAQKDEFAKRQKVAENKVASIKSYLQYALAGEKWKAEDASVSVSYRTTKDCVEIDDISNIPEEYFKTPHTESNLNKTAIKDAILDGTTVPGTHLADRISTIIK